MCRHENYEQIVCRNEADDIQEIWQLIGSGLIAKVEMHLTSCRAGTPAWLSLQRRAARRASPWQKAEGTLNDFEKKPDRREASPFCERPDRASLELFSQSIDQN